MFTVFLENIWETLLVLPESLFRPLKFSLWSSQNHCSVPSNSVYSPPKIIVLSPPNYKSLFPPKSLLCPLKFLHQSTKNIVLSPPNSKSLVPPKNHCFVPSKSKSLFCPLKSVYGHFKIIVLSPQIWQICENLKFEPNSTDFEWWFRVESGVISKTVDKKRDLCTFCRWSNLSRFTRFWGDQSDHKFAVGGPQLILRAGPPAP